MHQVVHLLLFWLFFCGWPAVEGQYWSLAFEDNFDLEIGEPFPNDNWILAPRNSTLYPCHAQTVAYPGRGGVITFSGGTDGGDIFTNSLIRSPSGIYRAEFDYWSNASVASGVYVGWVLTWKFPLNPGFEGRSGWIGFPISTISYCSNPVTSGSCTVGWQALFNTGNWTHYVLDFTLTLEPGNYNYTIDPNDARMGIRLSLEGIHTHANVTYVDNFQVWVWVNNSIGNSIQTETTGTVVQFVGDTPNFTILPKSGGTTNGSASIMFDELIEFNATQMLKILAFPVQGYLVETSPNQTLANSDIQFTTTLENTTMTVGFRSFNQTTLINYADSQFTVSQDATKWVLQVANWEFTDPTNMLNFTVRMSTDREQFVLLDQQYISTEHVFLYTLASNGTGAKMNVSLSELVIVDGNVRTIGQPQMSDALGNGVGIGQTVDRIVFTFPFFVDSLVYDPDFTLLVNYNDQGGSNLLYLISLVALLPLVLLAGVVVIVVVTVVIRKVRKREIEMVQFE